MARSSLDQFVAGWATTAILVDLIMHADQFRSLTDRFYLALDNRCIDCGYRLNHPIVNHEEYHAVLRSQYRTGYGSGMRMHRNNVGSDIQPQHQPVPLA